MAIEPNTTIKIYANVPLDINQDRSIAWANITEQNTYFHGGESGILVKTYANSTYQRVRKGVMRIEETADFLYDCNYLAFQNTNYGNKWFYAFITSVEYVNDITSEITFEIDELQTWYFDMTLQPCIVERCHTTTDVIGEHIEPEPVTLGEYVFNIKRNPETQAVMDSYAPITALSDLCVIVSIVDTENHIVGGKYYDGIYGGCTLKAFNHSDITHINALIEHYMVIPDSIVSIYMCPSALVRSGGIPDGGYDIPSGMLVNPTTILKDAITTNDHLDGYNPRNNKLYTYPYKYYQVDNSNGSVLKLRYEFFVGNRPAMEVCGCITQPCEIMLRPFQYKNSSTTAQVFQQTLNTETLSLTSFPVCSWSTDGFQAWLVNKGIPYGIHAVGDLLNVAMGAGSLSPGGLVNGVMDTYYSAKTEGQQDIIRGNFSNSGANCATGRQQFYGGRCSITAEYAKIIDDFFDKYGYTCMRLQTPNLRARPHWSYVKTRDCALTGNLPATSKQSIKEYFNKGITFWKVPSEVGNYSLSNTPQ